MKSFKLSFLNKIKVFILLIINFTWCLPQNIIGLIYFLVVKIKKQSELSLMVGANIIVFTTMVRGGVSLGRYIFLSNGSSFNSVKHECGHTWQSYILGPLYLLVIGIPSILWNRFFCKHPEKYYTFWTEKWADKLGNVKRN